MKQNCALLWGPFLWGPLFGRTCWACLNPPLHGVCMSACLCLLATSRKNCRSDLHEDFTTDVSMDKEELITGARHLFQYVTNQPPKANSAFHPSGVGKWVPASAGKAKAGMVHSDSGWTRGVQVKLWDPLRTRAIPERLRGTFTTRRYTNPRLRLPLPLQEFLKDSSTLRNKALFHNLADISGKTQRIFTKIFIYIDMSLWTSKVPTKFCKSYVSGVPNPDRICALGEVCMRSPKCFCLLILFKCCVVDQAGYLSAFYLNIK